MEKLNPKTDYNWDELVESRHVIKKLAELLDVSQDYLENQTGFLKGVTLNNKFICIANINTAIDRVNELTNSGI
jgi:hypothetical protein